MTYDIDQPYAVHSDGAWVAVNGDTREPFQTKRQADAWVHFLNESPDLAFVDEDTIDAVCRAVGDDRIRMHWDMLQHEIECLRLEELSYLV